MGDYGEPLVVDGDDVPADSGKISSDFQTWATDFLETVYRSADLSKWARRGVVESYARELGDHLAVSSLDLEMAQCLLVLRYLVVHKLPLMHPREMKASHLSESRPLLTLSLLLISPVSNLYFNNRGSPF